MKIMITGGGGFLGRGMAIPLAAAGHSLRLMGRSPIESEHESAVGDVTKMDDLRKAMAGVDAVIINHMAPRSPNAYETPGTCFEINVTGTANIFEVGKELGIKKFVIISTTGTKVPADYMKWIQTRPLPANGLYGATKECQEALGIHYAREENMQVSVLRVGYIVNAEEMQDKYGRSIGERAPLDCDRRDVGEVARLALEDETIEFEVFPVMSTREALETWGSQYTVERLKWTPRYDFDVLPMPDRNK